MDTYEKKYKEALERARETLNDGTISSNTIAYLQDIFPELKVSEDEKVRKALIEMVHDTTGDELWVDYNVHKEEALAWLEKQSEQNPINYNEELKKCRENPLYFFDKYVKLKEQKSAWSEEDEYMLESIVSDFAAGHKSSIGQDKWLKSLKDRCDWKPSDEQMDALHYVTNFDYGGHKATLVSLYEQLKKLKG